jgi:hypothetical protein
MTLNLKIQKVVPFQGQSEFLHFQARIEDLARLSHDGWIFQAAAAMAGTPGRFPASKSV